MVVFKLDEDGSGWRIGDQQMTSEDAVAVSEGHPGADSGGVSAFIGR